jgi:hypothetical protein
LSQPEPLATIEAAAIALEPDERRCGLAALANLIAWSDPACDVAERQLPSLLKQALSNSAQGRREVLRLFVALRHRRRDGCGASDTAPELRRTALRLATCGDPEARRLASEVLALLPTVAP